MKVNVKKENPMFDTQQITMMSLMKSYWFLYEEIKKCTDCPCNFLDGHQSYCRLLKKFNVKK